MGVSIGKNEIIHKDTHLLSIYKIKEKRQKNENGKVK